MEDEVAASFWPWFTFDWMTYTQHGLFPKTNFTQFREYTRYGWYAWCDSMSALSTWCPLNNDYRIWTELLHPNHTSLPTVGDSHEGHAWGVSSSIVRRSSGTVITRLEEKNPNTGFTCPEDPRFDHDVACPPGSLRNSNVPFWSNPIYHVRSTDADEKYVFFVSHGLRTYLNVTVSIGAQAFSLVDKLQRNFSNATRLELPDLYGQWQHWGHSRVMVHAALEGSNASAYRWVPLDEGIKCHQLDVSAWWFMTSAAGTNVPFCQRPFGECISKPYSQYYQNLSSSFHSLPHRDRLVSSRVTSATAAQFQMPSLQRLSVDQSFDRTPLFDDELRQKFEQGCPAGSCEAGGYDPRTGSSRMSRFILVPDHNFLTLEVPKSSSVKEPALCHLAHSFQLCTASRAEATWLVRFENCGNHFGVFSVSSTCENPAVRSSIDVADVVLTPGESALINVSLTLVAAASGPAGCSLFINQTLSRSLWRSISMTVDSNISLSHSGFCPCDEAAHCNGHGVCSGPFACNCTFPFKGTHCSECLPSHYGPACSYCARDDTCGGHGECSSLGGGCICDPGWSHTHRGDCSCHSNISCSSHGTCGSSGCRCSPCFRGEQCQQHVIVSTQGVSAYNIYEHTPVCPSGSVRRCSSLSMGSCELPLCQCICLSPPPLLCNVSRNDLL
eukprot:NODE_296_length_2285_cov_14.236136_g229_i0.p1 GENE.NODE_296_length_2285_cov_14.236136_g229_i0~~NODE_296_length_2285_cov_14.236136_g229_i0.p1  ORF type:complete len:728 (+),score=39.46 NODE_296_length_2285_cov_14.236136_g229_i0:178-2184(+)